MTQAAAEAGLIAALNRFADLVNRGEMTAALACFTDSPSIVEDIAPFRWEGPHAGGAWLTAMGENAVRGGVARIHMQFGPPKTVMLTDDHAYAVLPGDLTFTLHDGDERRDHGHITFTARSAASDWKIESLTWGREGP